MLTMQIEWPLPTRSAVEYGSGRRSFPLVRAGRFEQVHPICLWWEDWPLMERCWHGLDMSHDHPCLYRDQPQLLLTSEDRTHVTIISGLSAIPRNGNVVCVKRGAWRERRCSNVSNVMWRFVWTEIVLRITTQRTTNKTFFRPSSVQTVEVATMM
jgi:hypothetical protein